MNPKSRFTSSMADEPEPKPLPSLELLQQENKDLKRKRDYIVQDCNNLRNSEQELLQMQEVLSSSEQELMHQQHYLDLLGRIASGQSIDKVENYMQDEIDELRGACDSYHNALQTMLDVTGDLEKTVES